MRGHIRKRGDSWSIVVELGRDPVTGKRKQQWQSIKGTKKDAERELSLALSHIEQGSYTKPTKVTVGEYLESWLQDYVDMHVSIRTRDRYKEITRLHLIPALGSIDLQSLQPQHIQAYYTKALESGRHDGQGGLSTRTVRLYHGILSSALKQAMRMGMIVRNPAELVDPPRATRKEIPSLDAESVNGFLEVSRDSMYYPVFYTAVYTGLRRGEILGLRWCDIDLDLGTLSVVQTVSTLYNGEYIIKEPKTKNSRRQIALSPSLALLLRKHKEDQEAMRLFDGTPLQRAGLVFSHIDGSPYNPDSVSQTFRKIIKSAGLKAMRFHDLRHAHATLMLKQGVHPKIVSERLGHSSVNITLDTYSHVLPGLQEAAALRFEEGMLLASEDTLKNNRGLQNVCKTAQEAGLTDDFVARKV